MSDAIKEKKIIIKREYIGNRKIEEVFKEINEDNAKKNIEQIIRDKNKHTS